MPACFLLRLLLYLLNDSYVYHPDLDETRHAPRPIRKTLGFSRAALVAARDASVPLSNEASLVGVETAARPRPDRVTFARYRY